MKFARRQQVDRRRIDMTPMIDCVFQLLLFFLVATHFEEEARSMDEAELKAILPQAAAAMPMVSKPREIIVNIDRRGRFIVQAVERSEAELLDILRQARVNNPQQSVIIRGDESCPWKFIARAMSLCNKARIRDYRVAVIPEPTGGASQGGPAP